MCFAVFPPIRGGKALGSRNDSQKASQGETVRAAEGEVASNQKWTLCKAVLVTIALLMGVGWSWFLGISKRSYACEILMHVVNHEDSCIIETPKPGNSEGSSLPRPQPETRAGVPASTHTTGH